MTTALVRPAARPQFITARRPELPTAGHRVAALASGFGRPFMPWQRQASELFNELDPATGLRVHSLCVLAVQRQAGKTELVKNEAVERCLFGKPGTRVWYTAQTGQYASEKWGEVATALTAPGSPLAGYVSVRWAQGSQCLTFPNGSTFRPFPPVATALHSMQSDLVIVDEAWVHSREKGAALLAAIGPTQATRPGAQIMVLSTMGTDDSTWFHDYVDDGRAGAITYAEWGIGPDGDPLDLPAVIAAHPAVGHTILPSFIETEQARLRKSPGEFARAYGNARTRSEERWMDLALWTATRTAELLPADLPPVLGAAVAQDGSRTAIVAAVAGIVEVIESRPGSAWARARIVELAQRFDVPAVLVASTGPSAALYSELATHRDGVEHLADDVLTDAAKVATVAPARFMDRLGRPELDPAAVRHRAATLEAATLLDAAADAVIPRNVGDGWTWGRRNSAGPIPELEAATWAAWADEHRPAGGRPEIITAA